MKITRRHLSLLIESYLLTEHNKREFTDLVSDGSLTQNDYNQIYKPNGQPKGIFRDNTLRRVLYNTLLQKQGHSVDDFIDNFRFFKQKIIDPFNRNQLRVLKIPGTSNDQLDLSTLLSQQKATYDDFQKYVEIIGSTDSRSEALQQIIDEGFAGNQQHFEVIFEDDNWIVCYPKTYQGSIATARMGPDKQYYTPPNVIGQLTWCTAIDSGGNMFLNYHRRMNLHMYYITKKQGFHPRSPDKKLCASFVKESQDEARLSGGNSTVDGNNNNVNKEALISYIGNQLFDVIKSDAKKPEREVVTISEYYESVSFEQYTNMRNAAREMNSQDYDLFIREIYYYVRYSKNSKIQQAILDDDDSRISTLAFRSSDPAIANQVAERFINSEDVETRQRVAGMSTELSRDIIERLLEDPSESVVKQTASRKDLPDDIAKKLSESPSAAVRERIARNESIEDYDIVWALCKDVDNTVRKSLAYRKNLPLDIKVELFYDDDKSIAKLIEYDFESLSKLTPVSDSLFEDRVGEIGQTVEFNVDEEGEAGTVIWKLTDDLYSEKNTFALEDKFERYIEDYNNKSPRLKTVELDNSDAIWAANTGLKALKSLNSQRREYYKFVLSGRAAEAGLPSRFLNLDRYAIFLSGVLDR